MNRIISAALCCALGLAVLTGCQSDEPEAVMDQTVTVETAVVESGSLSSDSTYIGTISAEGTASVVTMVAGTVEELNVEVGDAVSPNDVLCRIDDENARLSLQNAQASYNSALAGYGGSDLSLLQEQLRMAQENYDNSLALLEIGAASQTEVDQANQSLMSAQSALDAARATLSSAQAGVEMAQYQLSLYNITSPISGVVEAVNVTEHNFAPSGTTAFVISNGENKTVTFYITDQVRKTLTLGQPVTVSYLGNSYGGTITEISGVVDAAVGQFEAKAVIDGATDLPDGLSVSLTTTAYRVDDAAIIPSDALFFENGITYVYLAQDGQAVRTDVEIGLYTSDTIAVISGLAPGDEVITTWSANLRDGASVRLADDAAGQTDAGSEAEGA